MAIKSVSGQSTVDKSESINQTKINKPQIQTSIPTVQNQSIISDKNVPDFRVDLKKFELNKQFAQLQTPIAQTPSNQLGDLKEGDKINIPVGEKDSQSDVLKKAYTEFAKQAGVSDAEGFAAKMVKDGDQIYHQNTNTAFTKEEFEAKRTAGSINIVPTASDLTALRQAKIGELTSYGLFDWSVTSNEQKQVVEILKNDPNLSQTVQGLGKDGTLGNLIDRVDNTENRRDLIDLLGKKLNDDAAKLVQPMIEKLDVRDTFVAAPGGSIPATDVNQNLWQARFNLSRLGVVPTDNGFDRSKYTDLVNPNGTSPFSGVGATGVNPTTGSVPLGDQWNLLTGDANTIRKYSNPLGGLTTYLNSLSPQDRARQAELLLKQPISTTMPEIYGDKLPSRADVIQAAAKKYNLRPELIAGFILAEQRDQTKNEDAKDYTAATSIKQANTSIGLGQVVVSTAQRNNLFSDLMSERTQKGMKHNDVARILADDTANIFAAAKYLRQVADEGATKSITALPNTKAKFPAINLSDYSKNSSQWSDDNIRALGSEYTSKAWDDNLSDGWGDFVLEATRDVKRSNVFKP
jgi:hypothetical protein